MAVVLLTTACGQEKPKPVDIEPGDMCASCKMAISQKKYAAEFVDKEGTTFKFDDIGCMLRFVKVRGLEDRVEAYFVVDYGTQNWLDARSSAYVKSAALPSPMGSGLIAVKEKPQAEALAERYHGTILAFDDLSQM